MGRENQRIKHCQNIKLLSTSISANKSKSIYLHLFMLFMLKINTCYNPRENSRHQSWTQFALRIRIKIEMRMDFKDAKNHQLEVESIGSS